MKTENIKEGEHLDEQIPTTMMSENSVAAYTQQSKNRTDQAYRDRHPVTMERLDLE